MHRAVLLIAHGSRRAEANDDLCWLAEQLRTDPQFHTVETCFLEVTQPDIPGGGRRCVDAGAQEVLLLPVFLSAGSHVTRDLSAARDALQHSYAAVRWVLCEPIGRHPLLVEILKERLHQAVESR